MRKIAVVDDHTMFRRGLSGLINMFGNYQVIFDACSGKDFIEKLNPGNLPDIVLMDISMPQIDGYETTEWLQANYPDIKVLALSNIDAETALIKMIKCGAKGYILKDADPSELKLAFDEVLSVGYFYNEKMTRKVMNAVNQLIDPKNQTAVFVNLSSREITFLKLVCTEFAYKEIADQMSVSVRTVEGYRDALCEKLNLKTRVGLAMYAIRNKIVELETHSC